MRLDQVRPFLLSACFLLAVGLVAALLSGCDGNHIIGEEPDVCFVEDECVDTVIDEFCDAAECNSYHWAGYADGYAAGIASVTVNGEECPDAEECVDRYDEGFHAGKRYFKGVCEDLLDEYYGDVETGEVCFTEIA